MKEKLLAPFGKGNSTKLLAHMQANPLGERPPTFKLPTTTCNAWIFLNRPSFYVSLTTSSLFFDFELKPPITSLPTSILVTLTCKIRMPNDIASCVSHYKSLETRLIPFSIVPISLHSSNPQSTASCSTFDNSTSGHGQLTQTPKK